MTKDEIKKMVNTCNNYYSCALCPYNPEDISRFIGDRRKGGCPDYDRKLVYAMGKGYGNVSEYEAKRKMLGSQIKVLKQRLNDKYIEIDNLNRDYRNAFERLKSQQREIERLKAENEQLKVKLEKNPLAIKQKIMEEDDYELTEREQATLFLDRMGSDVEILHDIVENLDELLGKGIDEYIKGIDGVEGIKDMWERSAVRDFAEKLWNKIKDNGIDYKIGLRALGEEIDELLKEYE